jgi:histidinol-phosphate/aromatic aminotransferase/cobyric acid decarboxylase-like protein
VTSAATGSRPAAEALRFHGDRVARHGALDFAVNVWPAPRPAWLDEALTAGLRGERYPDERAAVTALASRHTRPESEVLPANGACEAFWLLAAAFAPRHAVCVHPAFTEPEAALRAAGVPLTRVLRRAPTWELRPEEVPADADLVVLGNPNNPTGTLDRAVAVEALARPGRTLVVDEAFMDFVPGERESLAGRRDIPGLLVVRSLTKLWSLAGIRAGYVLGAPAAIARLRAHRQPWSVNAPALAALATCAADRETPARVAAEVAAAREELVAGLVEAGLEPFPSRANFLLVRLPSEAQARLARHGIAVRPAASFPGLDETFVRIAVRHPAENRQLLEALHA